MSRYQPYQQTGYTTGSGYVAPRLEQPTYAPQQQAAPSQQQAAGTPWHYGDLSGMQFTQGGDNDLTQKVYQKKAQLEDWVHHMRVQGHDVVNPRNSSDWKHHALFNSLVGELNYQVENLKQSKARQDLVNQQLASGRLMPGAPMVNAATPFDQRQFEASMHQVSDHPYVKAHNELLGKPAESQADLQRQWESYHHSVNALQQEAARFPGAVGQQYVEHQVAKLRRPAEGIERTVGGSQTSHQNWSTSTRPETRRGGAGSGGDIGVSDVLKLAQIVTGRARREGVPGLDFSHSFNALTGRKLGNGADAPTVLNVEQHPITGVAGLNVQAPSTTSKGKRISGKTTFVPFQLNAITGEPDVMATMKTLLPQNQYGQLLDAMVENGYVHLDEYGNPTEIANLPVLLEASGVGDTLPNQPLAPQSNRPAGAQLPSPQGPPRNPQRTVQYGF